MPRSHWKLHLDVDRQDAAEAILGKCVIAFDRPPIESKLEAYAKGGYMAKLEFFHNDDLSWQEQVFEILLFAQKLGVGWSLLGSVQEDPSGVLSKDAGARISMVGLSWAEWQLFNEKSV